MSDDAPVSDVDAATPGLARLVEVIERLHRDHTVSFIAAGDEKIYAYGGGGYIAIVPEAVFDGVVDVETPTKKFRIEPGDAGRRIPAGVADGDVPADAELADAAEGFERYYARRIGRV